MYELYFRNNKDKDEFKCRTSTRQEAMKFMVEDLKLKGIKPYYYRTWEDGEGVEMIDYGSHTTFYKIRKVEINNG